MVYFFSFLAFTFIFLLVVYCVIYFGESKCYHEYEINDQISLYKDDNTSTPYAYKYIQVCKKCGHIKTTIVKI